MFVLTFLVLQTQGTASLLCNDQNALVVESSGDYLRHAA
jgi:hypothetical protein